MTRLLLVALVLVAGCRARELGHFGPGGFYHVRDHYRVRYDASGEAAYALLPPEWAIENYQVGSDGRPTVANPADRYWTSFLIERSDGRAEIVRRSEIFDLRYVHRRDGSVIFARTVPLPSTMAERDLQVIMRDYVDRSSGGTYAAVSLFGETGVRERRAAPRVVAEGSARVSGLAAYYATVEIVDVDRHRVDPSAHGEMVTLVMMRPGRHLWRSPGGATLPMLLLFGYAARPELHSAHLSDFTGFVSRVDVRPPG